MARAAHAPLRPQVVHQLFFQYSPRLDEQAAVNGFVRHVHAPVVGILRLQPSGNLFGRPVQNQFTRNNLSQRLSRLPSASDLALLDRRKSKPFPWPHTTPPLESRLISDGVASTY